ncbi:hypothetical protein NB691_003654 [Xanthomonas sacchari]|nr:hypothetical protein [Xanthomonas sacchari]MCW0447486.1 hypothetical protein [Xanthomonas sacchari]
MKQAIRSAVGWQRHERVPLPVDALTSLKLHLRRTRRVDPLKLEKRHNVGTHQSVGEIGKGSRILTCDPDPDEDGRRFVIALFRHVKFHLDFRRTS